MTLFTTEQNKCFILSILTLQIRFTYRDLRRCRIMNKISMKDFQITCPEFPKYYALALLSLLGDKHAKSSDEVTRLVSLSHIHLIWSDANVCFGQHAQYDWVSYSCSHFLPGVWFASVKGKFSTPPQHSYSCWLTYHCVFNNWI